MSICNFVFVVCMIKIDFCFFELEVLVVSVVHDFVDLVDLAPEEFVVDFAVVVVLIGFDDDDDDAVVVVLGVGSLDSVVLLLLLELA